jgi:GDP/UDP-N,N'-diacetylbacillosamine 2-epimerase (hydrolysing)
MSTQKSRKRKICVVTGTRAEYGLLFLLMKSISENNAFELQIIATAMHLSPEFGLTYKEIEKDGFHINKKVESLLSSDTPNGITKSMALTVLGLADAVSELEPDLMILLGDRFETFAAASVATVNRIPIAHIAGGESTEGAIDEAFRHSITKMSHIHFASTELYRKRIIQMGENPAFVYNVGAIGIDNIRELKLLKREEFEESIHFKLGNKNLLITFHPVTLENSTAEKQFGELLKALYELNDTHLIFTLPNADTDGRIIIQMIHKFVSENKDIACVHTSLGQIRYLSAIKYVDAVVGNSSSGIVEVPYFKRPTVNIGDRQKGRIMGETIINCLPIKDDIYKAIQISYSKEFKIKCQKVTNLYGNGNTVNEIMEVIKSVDIKNLLKKQFYDNNTLT